MIEKTNGLYGEFVIDKLRTDDRWALRALEIVANNQTNHEYDVEHTTEQNGIGFNGSDAKKLTGIFKFYENRKSYASHHNDGKPVTITEKQMQVLHKRMPKYWRQVIKASNAKKLHKLVAEAEIAEMNKITDNQLPLHIYDKWTFEETKLAFLNRLKKDELVLSLV